MSKYCFVTINLVLLTILATAFLISGCATAGRNFSKGEVKQIMIGRTTKQDVRKMFGPPWRTGLEDGLETWTYGYYKYNILKREQTTDLIIRFKDSDIVASYSFSTTNNE